MRSQFINRVTSGALAAALLLTNVLLPASPAFAFEGGETTATEQLVKNENKKDEKKDKDIDKKHKATLCHATRSAKNPYVEITVDYHSFTKKGHDTHNGPVVESVEAAKLLKSQGGSWGDIIPAVPEWDYAGKNMPEGQAILENGCELASEDTENTLPLPTVVPADLCGLDNAYWDVDALNAQGTAHITFKLNKKDELVAIADEGYVFEVNQKAKYNFGAVTDSGALCEATSEQPQFVDNCGVLNDYYIVKNTDHVAYYNGETLLVAGVDNKVTDASKVTVTAQVTDEDYSIVNDTQYPYQFKNQQCPPEAELSVHAKCKGTETKIIAHIKNPTDSDQAYQVIVRNDSGVLKKPVIVVAAHDTHREVFNVDGDGTFVVKVYAYDQSTNTRGELLAKKPVTKECPIGEEDNLTPEIYKMNQNGQILSGGVFEVRVCNALWVSEENSSGCVPKTANGFDTDGSWFKKTFEDSFTGETTVTITETHAPVGCTAVALPWVFRWEDGGWTLQSGMGSVNGDVFNLTNQCEEGGKGGSGGETPTPTPKPTPKPSVTKTGASSETLANTGTSTNGILAIAVAMLLASIGFAVSPRFGRTDA